MELTGTVKHIGNTVVVSDKFKKREVVITDNSNEKYPQQIAFQLQQDKVSLADKVKVGDNVLVSFNLRGKEYIDKNGETKYFSHLEIWKLTLLESDRSPKQATPQSTNANVDDLPF